MTNPTGFEDSTPLLGDAAALRQRIADDGYFCLRGLLPPADVLSLRAQILGICQKYGWIAGGTDLMDGIASAAADTIEPWMGVGVPQSAYADVYRLEAFHRLAHHPAIVTMMETLLGEPVLVHPRTIGRIMVPAKANFPTPPHQDFIHIQGTKSVYTCWVPLGDCPQALGGLSMLPGSTDLGVLPLRQSPGAGGHVVILDGVADNWRTDDYQAGDVLVFHSLTVHKSLPNLTGNRIRLSCDYRYQPVSLPVEPRTLSPHCDVLTWEDAYAGWPANDLKYFWRQYPLEFQAFDPSLFAVHPG